MIANERQYRITKSQAEKFRSAVDGFNELDLVRQGLDPVIISAQRSALTSQLKDLEAQIARYEALKSGEVRELIAEGPAEVGEKLIEARIAVGLTQRELAVRLGMKEQQIQRYEHERYQGANLGRIAAVSQALNIKLNATYHFSADDDRTQQAVPSLTEFDVKCLPIREMKKRGWLKAILAPTDDNAGALSDADLASLFVTQAVSGSQVSALHRQNVRVGGKVDRYALLAWKARVLQKARRLRAGQATLATLDPIFVKTLVGLSSQSDGPVRAVQMLRENGIAVVFEERMPATHLDGAAMLLDNTVPVIGMTLRHDREDNFWFVLMHELAHVICHRNQGLSHGFFDDDSAPASDKLEKEADEFAVNSLIPNEVWFNSFVRFTKNRKQVLEFADRLGIGPAIVAGRIRNERKDYGLFSDMIGNRQVKKLIVNAGWMEK